ncbi:hypothetical protein L211DRAFT_837232, partial [Terfezia boudieri ATCC MYA-4762]
MGGIPPPGAPPMAGLAGPMRGMGGLPGGPPPPGGMIPGMGPPPGMMGGPPPPGFPAPPGVFFPFPSCSYMGIVL